MHEGAKQYFNPESFQTKTMEILFQFRKLCNKYIRVPSQHKNPYLPANSSQNPTMYTSVLRRNMERTCWFLVLIDFVAAFLIIDYRTSITKCFCHVMVSISTQSMTRWLDSGYNENDQNVGNVIYHWSLFRVPHINLSVSEVSNRSLSNEFVKILFKKTR